MKFYNFNVKMRNGHEYSFYCGNSEEAKILAQAKEIELGNSYQVDNIYCVETGEIRYMGTFG